MLLLRSLFAAVLAVQAPLAQAAPLAAPGSYLRAADYRVAALTYRLGRHGAALCEPSPLAGMLLHHLGEYRPVDRPEAARHYGLSEGPGILAAVEGGPAARAGLAAGDVLLAVNGKPFPAPAIAAAERDEDRRRRLMEAADMLLEQELSRGPAKLQVRRAGQRLELVLEPELGCEARGRLARSRQANAFADGRYAIVTTRLLEFIGEKDEDLAVVLAHELAHNILRHQATLDEQKVPRGILRNFGKNAARVHATEEEADRLGIKLLAAAGFDPAVAIGFWRRLYAAYDPTPTPKLFRTHPSLAARERMIREAVAELNARPTAIPR